MDQEFTLAAEATGCFGLKGPAELRIRQRGVRERLLRAAKGLALGWGIAVVSVLVPIAHWILVPSFLLLGPILAIVAYGQENVVMGGDAQCPECKTPVVIDPGPYNGVVYRLCPHCRSYVRIEPTAPKR